MAVIFARYLHVSDLHYGDDSREVLPTALRAQTRLSTRIELRTRGRIGKSDTAFRAGWRSLVFSGQAAMPRSLDSETALVDYVAATPGAIGYVTESTAHGKVKTLAVR